MKYLPIDPELFVGNRQRLVEHLEPNSIVILVSNDLQPTNADGTMPFRQNSDLFYLSGVDQPESVLVLFPDATDEERRELLFLKETSDLVRIWEGPQLSRDEATRVSGIKAVHWLADLPKMLRPLMLEAETVYLNTNEHARADVIVETREHRFVKQCQAAYPLHHYRRLAPLMHQLRARKNPQEIDLIRQACAITEKGFRRILRFIRPGVTEYEIEAEFSHEFLRNRAGGFAYPPIIASGANACVLHYVCNDQTCRAGELILLDVAAVYANYASDLTRTVPVDGRFTRRQKAVYNAVLRVLRACIGLLRPGLLIKDYHKQVGQLMETELIGLDLLKAAQVKRQDPKQPLYRKYFMHGTSHFLGLDVHDVGLFQQPIEENMVFTVEPGIYIPEEKMGVRLEDNVLVRAEGNIDLMRTIPIEAEEIEQLMRRGRQGTKR